VGQRARHSKFDFTGCLGDRRRRSKARDARVPRAIGTASWGSAHSLSIASDSTLPTRGDRSAPGIHQFSVLSRRSKRERGATCLGTV